MRTAQLNATPHQIHPHAKLAVAIRSRAEATEDRITAELLRCLARLLEGKSVYATFGAPDDWGSATDISYALHLLYRGTPDVKTGFRGAATGAKGGVGTRAGGRDPDDLAVAAADGVSVASRKQEVEQQ